MRVLISTFILCAAFLTASGQNEAKKPYLAELHAQKADITKLDWFLLKARLQFAEFSIVHHSPVSLAGDYVYDLKADKITVDANVDPDWYLRTNTDDLSTTLKAHGDVICLPFAVFLGGTHFLDKCTVEFHILLITKGGQVERRTATFEKGRLHLP